jgi:hypothetical protein
VTAPIATAFIPEFSQYVGGDARGELMGSPQSTKVVTGEIMREITAPRAIPSGTQTNESESLGTQPTKPVDVGRTLIRLPEGSLPREQVRVLQQWECVVTDVDEASFFAELQDLGDPSCPIEIVQIPLDEVPREDHDLLECGSVFYWSIGFETSPGGQLKRVSEIRFRRTPRWTKRAIENVERQAEELLGTYGWK